MDLSAVSVPNGCIESRNRSVPWMKIDPAVYSEPLVVIDVNMDSEPKLSPLC